MQEEKKYTVFIVCSKVFYNKVPPIKEELEEFGIKVILPNSYENTNKESEMKGYGLEEHSFWKYEQRIISRKKIDDSDAVLCINLLHPKKNIAGYIGGGVHEELYDTHMENMRYSGINRKKPIFLMRNISDEVQCKDEIDTFLPHILNNSVPKQIAHTIYNRLEEVHNQAI